MEVLDMKRSIRPGRLLAVAIVAAAAVWPLAQLAYAGPSAPDVPAKIQVDEGYKVFLVGHAIGVQIYTCKATPTGYSWGSSTPRADLYGDSGQVIATHYGGPTWEAKDGSKAIGTRVDGVTVDTTAIPWLLLSATTSAGPGGDRLVPTAFIQRVATVGGLPPAAADCNAETVGTVEEVDYTADYYFWKRQDA